MITGDVQAEEAILKRCRPARPRRDEALPTTAIFRARASVGDLKEREYAELKLRASCLVLITNMLDAEEYPAGELLRDYKKPTAVELQSTAIAEDGE